MTKWVTMSKIPIEPKYDESLEERHGRRNGNCQCNTFVLRKESRVDRGAIGPEKNGNFNREGDLKPPGKL
jgi:hypothetical protein